MLPIVEFLNVALLTIVGFALILGTYSRIASLTGASLIFLYYIAHPPFAGMSQFIPTEGNYLIVDKNMIEFFALIVLSIFPSAAFPGFDRIRAYFHSQKPYNHSLPLKHNSDEEFHLGTAFSNSRRELLKNLVPLPILGGFALAYLHKRGWFSYEEEILRKADAVTGASRIFSFAKLVDIKGTLPVGKIGGIEVSRLIFGGNLINGAAHARDLKIQFQNMSENKVLKNSIKCCVSRFNWLSFQGFFGQPVRLRRVVH